MLGQKTDSDSASSSESVSQYRNETYTTTDPALIKGNAAAQLVQSYSAEELGLPESWDKYDSVAVNDSGIKLDNSDYAGYYIEVEVSKSMISETINSLLTPWELILSAMTVKLCLNMIRQRVSALRLK